MEVCHWNYGPRNYSPSNFVPPDQNFWNSGIMVPGILGLWIKIISFCDATRNLQLEHHLLIICSWRICLSLPMMLLIICRRRILVLCIYICLSLPMMLLIICRRRILVLCIFMPVSSYDVTHNLQKEDFGLVYLYACLFL